MKPSLGESVLEGMRNLHLDDVENRDSRYASNETRNKAFPLNHTPKLHTNGDVGRREIPVYSPFIDPRPAPATPDMSVGTCTPSISSLTKRNSFQKLNILKSRRNSKSAIVASIKKDAEQVSRPPSSYRASASNGQDTVHKESVSAAKPPTVKPYSGIPRYRGVSSSGSPYASPTVVSPKTVQLKRAKGQIFDVVQLPEPSSSTPTQSPIDMTENWTVEQESPMNDHIFQKLSSVPSPVDQTPSRSSSNATVKRGYQILADSVLKNKENVNPEFDEAELARMRNFKFPAEKMDEVDEDNGSELTRVTSMSSKAGTIYAQDENGGYRLKPLSQNDPKHGPRVRIEDSADRLLLELDEEHFALVEAKRQAYLKKYPSLTRKHLQGDDSTQEHEVTPELASLGSTSEGTKINTMSVKLKRQSSVLEHSAKARKLAPPVPTNIPSLTHSPTGWPLLMSKIAPFAEVGAEAALANRRSASDSDLRSVPSTPRRDQKEDECPGSAYTLRTALHKLPRANSVLRPDSKRTGFLIPNTTTQGRYDYALERDGGIATRAKPKPRKSLPELVGRPFFPPRSSSKVNSIPPKGLKKQTTTLLESFTTQRASLKDHVTDKSNPKHVAHLDEGHGHAHPLVQSPSSPRYMQSFNTSIRHMNAHADIDSDLPSSPPTVSGIVPVSRPNKTKTKFSGLFHKASREGTLRRSMSRITMKASKEPFTPLSPPLQASPPSSSPMSRYGSIRSPKGISNKETPPQASRFPRLGHSIKANDQSSTNSPPAPSLPNLVTSALEPIELRDATQLAFTLLDRARDSFETGMRRREYVELAKAIVGTVSLAREVEKAAEEAKQAAVRAEMEAVKTKRAVVKVCECVESLVGRVTNGKDG